jgi:hypothetical protein
MACNGSAAVFPAEILVPTSAPGDAAADEEIEAPPIMDVSVNWPATLRWGPSTHARYPRTFKNEATSFILCHARLWNELGTLGVLPIALRDAIIDLLSPSLQDWRPIDLPRPDTPPPA